MARERIEQIQTACAKNVETKTQELVTKTKECELAVAKEKNLEGELKELKAKLAAAKDSLTRKEGEVLGLQASLSTLQKTMQSMVASIDFKSKK